MYLCEGVLASPLRAGYETEHFLSGREASTAAADAPRGGTVEREREREREGRKAR